MQSACVLIGLVGEFSAGVQAREDQFDAAHLLLGMDVDRHAAAVVLDFERAVLVKRHADVAAVAGERLVNAVVDDFVSEVVGPAGVRVHAGAAAHRIESRQDFNVGGGIRLGHR